MLPDQEPDLDVPLALDHPAVLDQMGRVAVETHFVVVIVDDAVFVEMQVDVVEMLIDSVAAGRRSAGLIARPALPTRWLADLVPGCRPLCPVLDLCPGQVLYADSVPRRLRHRLLARARVLSSYLRCQ